MTLDEIRVEIDVIDTKMRTLFEQRMECAKNVAEVKAETGGDVFVLERELAIIEKRAVDIDPDIYDEYVAFLRHMMSVSRRYQYGILTGMQDDVIKKEMNAAGLSQETEHTQVEIAFSCKKEASDLNLYINMAKLNGINIDSMKLDSKEAVQRVGIILDGNIKDGNMRRLLCQIGKEAEGFSIVGLRK